MIFEKHTGRYAFLFSLKGKGKFQTSSTPFGCMDSAAMQKNGISYD